jgi:predicted dehydrogenase
MNRRRFTATCAAALAAGAPAAAPPRRIPVGFLGVAHSHAIGKFNIARELADIDLVGIAEDSKAARAPFAGLGASFVSRDELLARAEVVIVESDVPHHARDAKLALAAGRHVHVEKPPAATLAEFREMIDLAGAKQRLMQVGYMWRFNPGINGALEAARQGWLGDVYLVRAAMNTSLAASRRPDWGRFKGGAMFELGSHLVDIVVRLLGAPVKVTPHLQRRGADGLADNCVAVFEYPTAQAIVASSVLQPNAGPHRFLEILGTNGLARVQPIEPPALRLELASPAGPHPAGAHGIPLPEYRRYAGELQELVASVRAGSKLPVTPDQDVQIQTALLAASEMA